MSRFACFISSHGLGHAARSAAVVAALQEVAPDSEPVLFTTASPFFFHASGCRNVTIHPTRADLGFIQKSALVEDLPETIRALDACLPFEPARIAGLADSLRSEHCRFVLCDIAPLGIAAAKAAGLPAVLIENFRWDDLYAHYAPSHPRMAHHAADLRPWFDAADVTIQTEPVCRLIASAALRTGPVARPPRQPRESTRQRLGLTGAHKLILITMGGVSERTPLLSHLAGRSDLMFVIPWGAERFHRSGNIVSLPFESDFYHPDLIEAADAVIGKVGYSTLAETYHSGIPYGYVVRHNYPEMPPLVHFIEHHMAGLALPDASLVDGIAPDFIDRLIALPRRSPAMPNGRMAIAELLRRYL